MVLLRTAHITWPLQKWTYKTLESDEETGLKMQECKHIFCFYKYRIIDKFRKMVARSNSLVEINDDWELLITLVPQMLENKTDKFDVSDEVLRCVSGICFRIGENGMLPEVVPYFEAAEIRAGDHLVAKKKIPFVPFFVTSFYHHAIYAGGGSVLHFTGDTPSRATVRLTKLDAFTENATKVYIMRHKWKFDTNTILRRGFSLLGEAKYSLFHWNCEHYCNYVITGVKKQFQITLLVAKFSWRFQVHLIFAFLAGIIMKIKQHIQTAKHGSNERDITARITKKFVN